MSLPDFVYNIYNSLLDASWKLHEIDDMDICGYLKVRAWKAKREHGSKKQPKVYIDQIWKDDKGR